MNIAYFDCQFGAAGDMLLGSMVAAGLSLDTLQAELSGLPLPAGSYKVTVEDTFRCDLRCKKLNVITGEHHPVRKLSDILAIIDNSSLRSAAKEMSRNIFKRLAEAEAHVHGIAVNDVHFHEVGAIDAIVDIVGFAIGYEILEIEESFVSALPLGSGLVKTEHGVFPIPAPATIQLLSAAGARISSDCFNQECITPTGAAILSSITTSYGLIPDMSKIKSIGYGAGSMNPDDHPNVCRLIIGDRQQSAARWTKETIVVLETNLDDLSPQIISYCSELLFAAGALDVIVLPATMKKGRTGHVLQVLCRPDDQFKLEDIIFSQTSALGVRNNLCRRSVSRRRWKEVQMENGDIIRIKLGEDQNGITVNIQPEFEDCAAYALKYNRPVKQVIHEVLVRSNS